MFRPKTNILVEFGIKKQRYSFYGKTYKYIERRMFEKII